MAEMQGETISFEGQQAYDVADMVKQYFRELPEALLTNKLSETFIAIFQRKKYSVAQMLQLYTVFIVGKSHWKSNTDFMGKKMLKESAKMCITGRSHFWQNHKAYHR